VGLRRRRHFVGEVIVVGAMGMRVVEETLEVEMITALRPGLMEVIGMADVVAEITIVVAIILVEATADAIVSPREAAMDTAGITTMSRKY